jgi:hypothetical protein
MEYDTMADPDHLAFTQDTKVIVSFMSLEMRLDCVDLENSGVSVSAVQCVQTVVASRIESELILE